MCGAMLEHAKSHKAGHEEWSWFKSTPFITKSKMTPSYPRPKSSPPHAIESKDLPTSFRDDENTLRPPHEDWDVFLEQDLSVQRIDEVFDHLWLVGRPYPPRSITIQNVLGRERVPVPDAALHLVWSSSKIYIKPLPRYLLAESFYDQYLTPSSLQRPGPGRDALGLLFSYLTLVPTETDFDMAQKDHLMPSKYTWPEWRHRASRVLHDYPRNSIYESIPRRYLYGELRHERLDKVYRYLHGHWLHGYSHLMGATSYGDFLSHNLGPIAAATLYIILVLTAMQVMLASEQLADELGRASYGFSVFSIVAPLTAVGIIVIALSVMVIANWARTVNAKSKRFDQLGIEHKRKRTDKQRPRGKSTTIDMVRFEPIEQHQA
ncbi:hypothetical protein LTR86_001755 [Recurvomyces mirabilis]|nr:hypothetical protein LTR86_001755 [Recurvomyces mirabilis]